jgi:hypothetical protein
LVKDVPIVPAYGDRQSNIHRLHNKKQLKLTEPSNIQTRYIAWDGSNFINTTSSRIENDGEISITKSTDKGTRFKDAKNLSNSTMYRSVPSIAISGNNRYLAWEDLTSGNHEICF